MQRKVAIDDDVAKAEFALKTYVLACNSEILAEIGRGNHVIDEIRNNVSLTEAPEDAVCSLVMDLRRYCDERKIDWKEEVISRANRAFNRDSDQLA